ncbi:MAG: tRNA (adenosine(37)-N6)-threonylcarbamoyltransferase complex ATPase subunit type 1 TsaE [Caldisericia bacterium]|nr:tRNA (adenosine(37)-N6)-threonylcarbamoyltransferase complex ATPase subunit type 1 TsaE [Caldisericia bacterium]
MKNPDVQKIVLQIDSERELEKLAVTFCSLLHGTEIIYLQGCLGAGKTTFTKKIAHVFSIDPHQVISPTFVLMKQYQAAIAIYHFDLYPLEEEKQLSDIDFFEILEYPGLKIVEWADKFPSLKKYADIIVNMDIEGSSQRRITIQRNL